MKNRKCIRTVSRVCRFICSWVIFFIILTIALALLGCIIALFDPETSLETFLETFEPFTLPMLVSVSSFGVILTVATLYGLFKLRSLLKLYEKEVYYSQRNVSCFRGMGLALIVLNVVGLIFACTILQMPDPLGALVVVRPQHAISYLFDLPSSFNLIFAGIVLLVISWAVDEGRKIKEEQEQFV